LTQLKTGADEDPCLRYMPRKLADETGLADPGLATKQHNRRPVKCRAEDLQKALQLNLAPDECRRGNAPRHVGQYPSGPVQGLDCV